MQEKKYGGRYLYRNNTSGDLLLARATKEGVTLVNKGTTFFGDSYYLSMLKPQYGQPAELSLVQTYEHFEPKKIVETLITEQPPIVSAPTPKSVVEVADTSPAPTLLVEDPLAGVDIIR